MRSWSKLNERLRQWRGSRLIWSSRQIIIGSRLWHCRGRLGSWIARLWVCRGSCSRRSFWPRSSRQVLILLRFSNSYQSLTYQYNSKHLKDSNPTKPHPLNFTPKTQNPSIPNPLNFPCKNSKPPNNPTGKTPHITPRLPKCNPNMKIPPNNFKCPHHLLKANEAKFKQHPA